MPEIKLSELIASDFYDLHRAIRDQQYTHYIVKGGRGSCKSSFISLEIIERLRHDWKNGINSHAIVIRKIGVHLRGSVYTQLLWAIEKLGRRSLWQAGKSPLELRHKLTGQKIIFWGADEPEKIKSLKTISGYWKYIWYEEYNQFAGEEEIRIINQSLMRGGEKFTVFYSFNPPKSHSNWTNALILQPHYDTLIHHSSYLTVPSEWLGKQFILEAERIKQEKPLAYRHEYLGEPIGSGGAVFDNLKIEQITDEQIAGFDKVYRGLDFGFAVDPDFYIVCSYHSALKKLWIYREWTKTGARFDDIAEAIQAENPKRATVTADSAEPRSIKELQDRGINITGAKKGPGSVEHGIKWLQGLNEIIIDTARCPNTAREFQGYEFEQDRNGNWRADFPDRDNHSIDATRYACEKIMQPVVKYKPVLVGQSYTDFKQIFQGK